MRGDTVRTYMYLVTIKKIQWILRNNYNVTRPVDSFTHLISPSHSLSQAGTLDLGMFNKKLQLFIDKNLCFINISYTQWSIGVHIYCVLES